MEKKKGRVYWLTGLSNSGKTTIGTALYYEMKKSNDNVVILDGDIMKDITTGYADEEYSGKSRLARAKKYSLLSKLLSDQGMIVIVCTISMFDEIRTWNRENIKGYVEVFIDAPEVVLRARDKRNLFQYSEHVELPKKPDLRIMNDGETSVKSFVKRIMNYSPIYEEDFDRDRDYWNRVYSVEQNDGPSQFARDITDKLKPGRHLLELGCGNGRDSLFFLANGVRVTGVDASDMAIEQLNKKTEDNKNALFICDDFVKCKSLYQVKHDYIYSRFTLHAINEEQEAELLSNIRDGLSNDGILFIEARTIHDDLYGLGTPAGHNAFLYNNHYRRFIEVDEFRQKLEDSGLQIVYLEERKGFSKTENSDPVLMRCIARLSDNRINWRT